MRKRDGGYRGGEERTGEERRGEGEREGKEVSTVDTTSGQRGDEEEGNRKEAATYISFPLSLLLTHSCPALPHSPHLT